MEDRGKGEAKNDEKGKVEKKEMEKEDEEMKKIHFWFSYDTFWTIICNVEDFV